MENGTVADNIKRLRNNAGWSQEKLAEMLGKTRSAVSQYEPGKIIPRMGVVEDLANLFGVKKSEIIGETTSRAFVPVPLYGSVAAGTPMEMAEAEEMKEAPARFVIADPDAYLVRVRGSSMNRIIHDGSYALVSPHDTALNDRDMFLVAVNGDEATIKHVRRLENGIELVPDSYDPTFRPKVFDFGEEGTPPVSIMGKIVWWCAEF